MRRVAPRVTGGSGWPITSMGDVCVSVRARPHVMATGPPLLLYKRVGIWPVFLSTALQGGTAATWGDTTAPSTRREAGGRAHTYQGRSAGSSRAGCRTGQRETGQLSVRAYNWQEGVLPAACGRLPSPPVLLIKRGPLARTMSLSLSQNGIAEEALQPPEASKPSEPHSGWGRANSYQGRSAGWGQQQAAGRARAGLAAQRARTKQSLSLPLLPS